MPAYRPWKIRFFEKFTTGPGCWVWRGHKNADGYGIFYRTRTKAEKAHRVAYELLEGAIPDGLQVLHHCDNPACVRPGHMFLGTQPDNMADMVQKGRQRIPNGEINPRAILTEEQVKAIRADTRYHRDIAADYGVCQATISHIKNGRNWRNQASG